MAKTEILDLNSTNRLRFQLSEFKGKRRLDIRHYWRTSALSEGEWSPSKKGINIDAAEYGQFRKCLDWLFASAELEENDGQVHD